MTDVYTFCPICGEEFRFVGGFFDEKFEHHIFREHDEEEMAKQLAHLWFGMAQQIVEDDVFVKEVFTARSESGIHEAHRRKTRADILSKIMNQEKSYKR